MATADILLDRAEYLARRRGFDAFSFADLAKAADIRKASVHYHFPTKTDLAMALIRRYRDTMSQAMDGLNGSAEDRLAGLIAIYRAALSDGESMCLCVSFSATTHNLSDEVMAEVNGFRDMVTTWLTKVFEPAADAKQQALAAFSLLEGAQLVAHAAHDVAVFDTATAGLKLR